MASLLLFYILLKPCLYCLYMSLWCVWSLEVETMGHVQDCAEPVRRAVEFIMVRASPSMGPRRSPTSQSNCAPSYVTQGWSATQAGTPSIRLNLSISMLIGIQPSTFNHLTTQRHIFCRPERITDVADRGSAATSGPCNPYIIR